MRMALKLLRVARGMTQDEAAVAAGYNRQYWQLVESGKKDGSVDYWKGVQRAFGIADTEMWSVMQNDNQ